MPLYHRLRVPSETGGKQIADFDYPHQQIGLQYVHIFKKGLEMSAFAS